MDYKHHIFLSYSRQDTVIMQRIRDDLRAADLTVWTDEGIEPGTPSWTLEIQNAIDNTICIVAIFSPDAKDSKFVRAELSYADSQYKKIIPLIGRGDVHNAVPFPYSEAQWIDITTQLENGIQQLIKSIFTIDLIRSDVLAKLKKTIDNQSRLLSPWNELEQVYNRAKAIPLSNIDLANLQKHRQDQEKRYKNMVNSDLEQAEKAIKKHNLDEVNEALNHIAKLNWLDETTQRRITNLKEKLAQVEKIPPPKNRSLILAFLGLLISLLSVGLVSSLLSQSTVLPITPASLTTNNLLGTISPESSTTISDIDAIATQTTQANAQATHIAITILQECIDQKGGISPQLEPDYITATYIIEQATVSFYLSTNMPSAQLSEEYLRALCAQLGFTK